jgi:hypothetical protein
VVGRVEDPHRIVCLLWQPGGVDILKYIVDVLIARCGGLRPRLQQRALRDVSGGTDREGVAGGYVALQKPGAAAEAEAVCQWQAPLEVANESVIAPMLVVTPGDFLIQPALHLDQIRPLIAAQLGAGASRVPVASSPCDVRDVVAMPRYILAEPVLQLPILPTPLEEAERLHPILHGPRQQQDPWRPRCNPVEL